MKTFEQYNKKEELEGLDLMNYLNDATSEKHFADEVWELKSHRNVFIKLYVANHRSSIHKHEEEFTIENVKKWINDIQTRYNDDDFSEILSALNDEDAMEIYLDSKELGLL